MSKVKNWFKDFALPFTAIVIASILITFLLHFFVLYFTGYNILAEDKAGTKMDNLLKFLATAISITGFASIILTIIQSRKSIQKDVQMSSIDLFKELRSETFIDARCRAWIVKDKWFEEDGYKEKLMKYNFSKRGKVRNDELDADIKVCYQLLEFYLLVSLYDDNEKMLKSLRYFYYGGGAIFSTHSQTLLRTPHKQMKHSRKPKESPICRISVTSLHWNAWTSYVACIKLIKQLSYTKMVANRWLFYTPFFLQPVPDAPLLQWYLHIFHTITTIKGGALKSQILQQYLLDVISS